MVLKWQDIVSVTSWHPPNKCYWSCLTYDGPGCWGSSETTFFAISKFLDECDCGLILIPGVMDEVPKFQDGWRTLEMAVGSKGLLMQKSPWSLQTGILDVSMTLCWQHSYLSALRSFPFKPFWGSVILMEEPSTFPKFLLLCLLIMVFTFLTLKE